MLVPDSAFFTIIQDTWAATLGLQVDRRDLKEFSETGAFSVSVRITGAWNGEVRLLCPEPLARLVAGAIFQLEADRVGHDAIVDALSELTHIVAGNLKAFLPQPVSLSLPALPALDNPLSRTQNRPESQVANQLTLETDGHTFVATLLGNIPAGQNPENLADADIDLPAKIS